MDQDFGSDYIVIEDEDGNEFELEVVMTLEQNGAVYVLLLPADMDEEDPDFGYIILRRVEENDEVLYDSVDDDQELVEVYNAFMEALFEEEEHESDDESPAE